MCARLRIVPAVAPSLPIVHDLLGHKYTDPQWEALCRPGCGACCYEHIEVDGRWIRTERPCALLDPESRRCRDYERRHELEPDCQKVTPSFVLLGHLPPDCGYMDELAARLDPPERGPRRRP